MTCSPTRPVMAAAELAGSKVRDYGRNYALSGDGYDDMDVATRQGWQFIPGWGRDGWDMGEWPYVSIGVRNTNGRFQLMQIIEGDHTVYEFATQADRSAALDYLFLWYAADKGLDGFPFTYEERQQLDAGKLTIDDQWRGPFRHEQGKEADSVTAVEVDGVKVALTRSIDI